MSHSKAIDNHSPELAAFVGGTIDDIAAAACKLDHKSTVTRFADVCRVLASRIERAEPKAALRGVWPMVMELKCLATRLGYKSVPMDFYFRRGVATLPSLTEVWMLDPGVTWVHKIELCTHHNHDIEWHSIKDAERAEASLRLNAWADHAQTRTKRDFINQGLSVDGEEKDVVTLLFINEIMADCLDPTEANRERLQRVIQPIEVMIRSTGRDPRDIIQQLGEDERRVLQAHMTTKAAKMQAIEKNTTTDRAHEDESAYVGASTLLNPDTAKDHKALMKILAAHPEIRRQRPKGSNGKPRANRLKVHAADWHNHFAKKAANRFTVRDTLADDDADAISAEIRKAAIRNAKIKAGK